MKNFKPLLTTLAFVVAIVSAAASSLKMDEPYYGFNPDTELCEVGTIQSTGCNLTSGIRCKVRLSPTLVVDAWDDIDVTNCMNPVFRNAR